MQDIEENPKLHFTNNQKHSIGQLVDKKLAEMLDPLAYKLQINKRYVGLNYDTLIQAMIYNATLPNHLRDQHAEGQRQAFKNAGHAALMHFIVDIVNTSKRYADGKLSPDEAKEAIEACGERCVALYKKDGHSNIGHYIKAVVFAVIGVIVGALTFPGALSETYRKGMKNTFFKGVETIESQAFEKAENNREDEPNTLAEYVAHLTPNNLLR